VSIHQLICGDVVEVLDSLGIYNMAFLDPPDAIKVKHPHYVEQGRGNYVPWLTALMEQVIPRCQITWLSYNAIWDLPIKAWANSYDYPVEIKPFVWVYSFGQHRYSDCGPGHRPMLRFRHKDAPLYPDQIRVPSWRQLNGDKRAAEGGRVPLDYWDFPRVVGNAKERRTWHPTQHPECLIERAVKLSTKEGNSVLDLFSGTGSIIRVCRRIRRNTTSVEMSPEFCNELIAEHSMKPMPDGRWLVCEPA